MPIEVRAGNVFYLDPATGTFPPVAPTRSNPFTGFVLPGAGAGGINIIDNQMQNPMVQQFNLGVERQWAGNMTVRADYLHNRGTHFIIGRTIGTVFNPVVGGPDRVVNLESSVDTAYDGLLLTVDRRFEGGHQFRAAYTLSKALNYANDDQIPFSNGPLDPNNLRREYGPTPNDQRHRLALTGTFALPASTALSMIWTVASGVPMDILMPGGLSRIPLLQRNAGNRQFHSAAELNAFLRGVNEAGGINGTPLPLVSDQARFSDSFNSLDLRLARSWALNDRLRLEPMIEVFNVLNTTNILGVSNLNYSGYSNVLVRDSEAPERSRVPGLFWIRKAGDHCGWRVRVWGSARLSVRGESEFLETPWTDVDDMDLERTESDKSAWSTSSTSSTFRFGANADTRTAPDPCRRGRSRDCRGHSGRGVPGSSRHDPPARVRRQPLSSSGWRWG